MQQATLCQPANDPLPLPAAPPLPARSSTQQHRGGPRAPVTSGSGPGPGPVSDRPNTALHLTDCPGGVPSPATGVHWSPESSVACCILVVPARECRLLHQLSLLTAVSGSPIGQLHRATAITEGRSDTSSVRIRPAPARLKYRRDTRYFV